VDVLEGHNCVFRHIITHLRRNPYAYPNSVKPLHQCAEKRHFTRLQTLSSLSRVIDRWGEFNSVGNKQGRGEFAAAEERQLSSRTGIPGFTVIASDLRELFPFPKKL
jgi:hypothetical protein